AFARTHGKTWQALSALLLPLVVALSVSLALSDAFPLFARLVAGPETHVCSCKIDHGHSECACPICHPEHADEYAFGAESVRGKCGSDSVTYGGKLGIAVAPSPVIGVAFAITNALPVLAPPLVPDELFVPPPVPPPRSESV
ncbi:MAG TPA: hypothetical protein VF407_06965, partial [Polyangiaceae bacterium]